MGKTIANQTSPSQILGRAATLLRLLEEEGLPYDAWQIPIDDPEKRRMLVAYWKAGMPPLTQGAVETVVASKRSAVHNVLTCVHDARQVNELFSLGYTEEQLTAFGPPPDSLPGFLTFFDPGWDILRLRTHCKDKGRIFYSQDWYDGQEFAKKQEEPRYRQIRMEAVAGSFNKTFDTQKALLPDTEEIPLVRQVVMGMVVHFLRTEQRMFPTYYVRCLDKVSDGVRVSVGNFDVKGLHVAVSWDDNRNDLLGLSSARKF